MRRRVRGFFIDLRACMTVTPIDDSVIGRKRQDRICHRDRRDSPCLRDEPKKRHVAIHGVCVLFEQERRSAPGAVDVFDRTLDEEIEVTCSCIKLPALGSFLTTHMGRFGKATARAPLPGARAFVRLSNSESIQLKGKGRYFARVHPGRSKREWATRTKVRLSFK